MFLRTSGIMVLNPHVYSVHAASYPAKYFRDSAWQGVISSNESTTYLMSKKF